MNPLDYAYLQRARSALDLAIGEQGDSTRARATAFKAFAFELLKAKTLEEARPRLAQHANPLVAKAAAATTLDAEWAGASIADLADSYLAEIGPGNLLNAIGKFASGVPRNLRTLVASGFTADMVAEGAPVAVRKIDLTVVPDDRARKAAAMVVLSKELATMSGDAGLRLFENELALAVNGATNAAVLSELIDTDTEILMSVGDPVADLQTALGRAATSTGYVVAANPGIAAALALSTANKGGMGIGGGTLVDGIEVVAVTGEAYMTIIPAGRVTMADYGLEIRSAGHATVEMADSPTNNSATPTGASMVSLWQTNSLAILAVRMFQFTSFEPVIRMAYGARQP